ncbi:TIGR02285 family protein [Bdellovibrio bacteriovorus]|uniref:TIGR02285 family protein n=1 Tax=Bdellovibrio bacteriovorus TaxID=959 RepID=UPI0035A5C760
MKRRILLSFLIVNIFCPLAGAKDLTWIRWDDPPIFIFSGPFKGQGVLDTVEGELRKKLPQYQHKTLEGTVPRVLKEAEGKSQICNAGWLDTPEWSKLFYFSTPVFVIPANGILLPKSRLDEVRNLAPYSLQKFLDSKKSWKLGVGRLYGEGIDEVLIKNNYQKNPQVITISTSLRVHKMLHSNRIQYTLGYPFEAVYYNDLLGSKADSVVHIPVTENSERVEVVVACPKTPWGAKVIADVDRVLQNKALLEKFEKGVDRWLSAEDREKLAPGRKEFYRKNYPSLK